MGEDRELAGIVILAGGRGERLGGALKSDILVGGRRSLEWQFALIPEGIPVVVVAPDEVVLPSRPSVQRGRGAFAVMEDPPRSGPAAGFRAGVEALRERRGVYSGLVGLVPVDAPFAPLCMPLLVEELAASAESDAVIAVAEGERQNVVGVFDCEKVLAIPAADLMNTSMKRLLKRMRMLEREVPVRWVRDIDTHADLERAQQWEFPDLPS